MNTQVQQALTLNRYAREGRFLSESWASDHFKATFGAALAAAGLSGGSTMGVTVSWHPASSPETVGVSKTSLATERTQFLGEFPIEGALGEALLADLTKLAVHRAVKDIRDEREQALVREATARVTQLVAEAAQQTPAMA